MILITLAVATLSAAIGNAIGRHNGFKDGVKRVFKDLDDGGSCHAFGHVAVGTTMPASDWDYGSGTVKAEDTPVKLAKIEVTTGDELCPSGWPAIRPIRIDPIDIEHARKVLVKGSEHPFLAVRDIG